MPSYCLWSCTEWGVQQLRGVSFKMNQESQALFCISKQSSSILGLAQWPLPLVQEELTYIVRYRHLTAVTLCCIISHAIHSARNPAAPYA